MKDPISRKKLYKSGKLWVAALVSTVALVGSSVALADPQTGTTTNTSNQSVNMEQPVKADSQSTTTDSANSQSNDQSAKEVQSKTTPQSQATQTETKSLPVNLHVDSESQLNDFAKNFVNEANAEGANVDPKNFSQKQIDALNKLQHYSTIPRNSNTTRYTYYEFQQDADKMAEVDSQFAIPYFRADQIKNLPAATSKDGQTGKIANMDIWDSWPVQDPTTGQVVDWQGKQLVIAMMGTPNGNSNHIYLLYNDYGSDDFNGWKNAGDIFDGYRGDKKTGLELPDDQEWSGSAYPLADGSIELFYTHNKWERKHAHPQNHQRLAAANLKLKLNADGTISIVSVDNDHTIFSGKDNGTKDGTHYQTYEKWAHNVTNFDGHDEDFGGNDNFAMRDPHIIKDAQGNRYLLFEASTGDDDYQSENQIYDLRNYGGNAKFQLESLFNFLNDDYSVKDAATGKMIKIGRNMRMRASQDNAAIGIIKLTGPENNPSVGAVYDPLVSALMVSDEIERPSVVKIDDTYYLFAASRLSSGSNDAAWRKDDDTLGDNVLMLGWYSKDLTKGFKPLNGSAAVITASVPANWRTSTYSYYAVPTRSTDPRFKNTVLITAYMTNRNHVADFRNVNGKAVLPDDYVAENGGEHNSTWAPSFLVRINPDGTTKVLPYVTNQGVWDFNNATKINDTLLTSKADEAYLPWEKNVPFAWDTILSSGMNWKDNLPKDPDTPDHPTMPKTPETPKTPKTPETPKTPTTPNTPETPKTPKTPKTPNTPGTPKVPETPKMPSTPQTPQNPGTPQTPEHSATPSTPEVPGTLVVNVSHKVMTPTAPSDKLPQTSDHASVAAVLLGMLGLTTLAGWGVEKRHF